MAKYRSNPVVIEATQWFPGIKIEGVHETTDGFRLPYVVTIHGQQTLIAPGDWIITEPDGKHHYPCKPDIFAARYRGNGRVIGAVDHPDHYGGADNPYEAIKVIEAWALGFNLGNTVKYISRAGKKEPAVLQDLKKARWYLDREIANLEKADVRDCADSNTSNVTGGAAGGHRVS